jgi:transcription elongation factor GreA
MRTGVVQLTEQGRQRLEEELTQLRDVKRPQLVARMESAQEDGDFSDEREFEDVREDMIMTERRIEDLEFMLAHAEVLERVQSDSVVLGSVVTITDDEGIEETWTLVSPAEADTRNGSISTESPVGQAVMGKSAGESAVVETPTGSITYTIKSVS